MNNRLNYLFTITIIILYISGIRAENSLANHSPIFNSSSISPEENKGNERSHANEDSIDNLEMEEFTVLHIEFSTVEDTTTEFNYSMCPGDLLIINGTIYDENNPYGVEVFTNSDGCDSTVVINLEYNVTITYSLNPLVCIDDSVIVNDVVYDKDNPAGTEEIMASIGCDTLVSIDLSFVNPSFTVSGLDLIADIPDASNFQWLLEGNPITGATNNSWTAVENGNYSLRIEVDDISCTSDEVFIETTDVYDIALDQRIKIYPNPIQDQIFIDLSDELEGKILQYELFNLEGKLIQKGNFQNIINIDFFTSGIFILRLMEEDKNVYVQKLKIR